MIPINRRPPISRLLACTAILLLLLTASVFAGEFMTTDSGAKVWADTVQKNETATWSGAVDAGGYATGPGTLQFLINRKPFQVYRGEMRDGHLHGSGKFDFLTSGVSYEGQFVRGQFHGKGLLSRSDGSYYDGNWFDGRRNGQGIYRDAKGIVYDGEWLDDKQHGSGVMTWPNGAIYVGEWLEGRQVKGVMTWPNGVRYEGEFDRGMPHGQGTMTWKNGDSYSGTYEHGSMNGKGTWRFFNGYYYEGEIERGELNGAGTLYTADGRVLQQGYWSKGKFVGATPAQEAAK